METEMKCSFCFKKKEEVKALVGGGVDGKQNFICDECVEKFIPIIREPTGGSAA